jgi:hypothetical protein
MPALTAKTGSLWIQKWLFNAYSGLLGVCLIMLAHGSGKSSSSSGPKPEIENGHVDIPM